MPLDEDGEATISLLVSQPLVMFHQAYLGREILEDDYRALHYPLKFMTESPSPDDPMLIRVIYAAVAQSLPIGYEVMRIYRRESPEAFEVTLQKLRRVAEELGGEALDAMPVIFGCMDRVDHEARNAERQDEVITIGAENFIPLFFLIVAILALIVSAISD